MTADRPILLDGGMGRELQRRGLASVGSIWSAEALLTHPDVVRDIHLAFIEAGAEVITTNTYAVTPHLLGREGMEVRLGELLDAGVRLAQEARDASGRAVRIAGSLPPVGDSYRPDLVPPEEELLSVYREIAKRLAPGVDIFLAETLSTTTEARAAVQAASAFGKPIWIAWSLGDDGNLRSGETPAEAAAALEGLSVEAYLFNCCTPESISKGLPALRTATERPIGAYANALQSFAEGYVLGEGGETPERREITTAAYAEYARGWRAAGADIIGGCCGIGPGHIAALRSVLA